MAVFADTFCRYENLIERRPLLLSSVLLRQNPHNVEEWERRAQIFTAPADIRKKLEVFAEAIATVDPMKAVGKPHRLWIGYATIYEKSGNLKYARQILQKAETVNFKTVGHLTAVWLHHVEMEIRHRCYDSARSLLRTATTIPPRHIGTHIHTSTPHFQLLSLSLSSSSSLILFLTVSSQGRRPLLKRNSSSRFLCGFSARTWRRALGITIP